VGTAKSLSTATQASEDSRSKGTRQIFLSGSYLPGEKASRGPQRQSSPAAVHFRVLVRRSTRQVVTPESAVLGIPSTGVNQLGAFWPVVGVILYTHQALPE